MTKFSLGKSVDHAYFGAMESLRRYDRDGGCSKGPRKEETIGNTLLQNGMLTKQATYIMAILGRGMLNNYHIGLFGSLASITAQGNPMPLQAPNILPAI